ncbi:discoidin domain-containing protein [Aurantivibrio infirmus]
MKLNNVFSFLICFTLLPLCNLVQADVTASGNVVVYNAVLESADPNISESWSWFQLSGVDTLSTCPTGDKGAGDLVYIAFPDSEKLASTFLLSAYGGGLELVVEVDDVNLYQGYCQLSQVALAPTTGTSGGGGGGTVSAHQYWRINGMTVNDLYLELSELELSLVDDTNLNSLATVTTSNAPNGGVGNVLDGNLTSRAWWYSSDTNTAAFYIQWDFGGSPQAVAQVRQAGYDNSARFMTEFSLQYSDDGVTWTTQSTQTGLTYPGNYTYSEYYDVTQ